MLALQVASMKRLLEEKNAAMERMKRKLDEARAVGRGAATADRSEAARLTDRCGGGRECQVVCSSRKMDFDAYLAN